LADNQRFVPRRGCSVRLHKAGRLRMRSNRNIYNYSLNRARIQRGTALRNLVEGRGKREALTCLAGNLSCQFAGPQGWLSGEQQFFGNEGRNGKRGRHSIHCEERQIPSLYSPSSMRLDTPSIAECSIAPYGVVKSGSQGLPMCVSMERS
jgi:hypothetical protein